MTSPHPPERASATLRAICLHSVVRGRATGRCVSSFRNPLFAWSGSRSRIHFHSVGCASLTRSNGLRTAFERHSRLARAVRLDTGTRVELQFSRALNVCQDRARNLANWPKSFISFVRLSPSLLGFHAQQPTRGRKVWRTQKQGISNP